MRNDEPPLLDRLSPVGELFYDPTTTEPWPYYLKYYDSEKGGERVVDVVSVFQISRLREYSQRLTFPPVAPLKLLSGQAVMRNARLEAPEVRERLPAEIVEYLNSIIY